MFLKKAIMYPLLFDDLSLDVVFGDTPGIQQLSLNLSNESRDFVYPGRNNSRGSMFIGLAVLPWYPHADPQLIPSFSANMDNPIFLNGIPMVYH